MIKIEKTKVTGWEHAVRGMRNPMNSWGRSDSYEYAAQGPKVTAPFGIDIGYEIGENDRELMMKLAKGGSVHAKYRRMITVYADITAPLYWWKEFDTYKVGTVANSCSTMHKIQEKEFTLKDFSCEHLGDSAIDILHTTINGLNNAREMYLRDGCTIKKECWWQMIQLLPSSYNQKRTVMMNYEVLAGIYIYRKDHKLDEWRDFCKWIERLPYSEIITLKETVE